MTIQCKVLHSKIYWTNKCRDRRVITQDYLFNRMCLILMKISKAWGNWLNYACPLEAPEWRRHKLWPLQYVTDKECANERHKSRVTTFPCGNKWRSYKKKSAMGWKNRDCCETHQFSTQWLNLAIHADHRKTLW